MDRGAIAIWNSPVDNAGTLTTDSGSLINVPCSKTARFELEAKPSATTPEELLAAAEAGCFTMTFSELLAASGHPAHSLRTEVRVQLVRPSGYWEIPSVRLHCTAVVPGISEQEFLAMAHEARVQSPIARALRADVTMTVSLQGAASTEWHAPFQQA